MCWWHWREQSHRVEPWRRLGNHRPSDWWLENVQLQRLLSLWTNIFLLLSWQTWNYYYYYWWTNRRSNNSCKKQASQNLNSIPTLKSIKQEWVLKTLWDNHKIISSCTREVMVLWGSTMQFTTTTSSSTATSSPDQKSLPTKKVYQRWFVKSANLSGDPDQERD